MNILISNDDGINSNGVQILAKTLAKEHNVLVVAPDSERSANSHLISICAELKLTKVFEMPNLKMYSLSGSPADCVKFALYHFKDFKPDITISGINRGGNLGTDVMYSGTVACAREASAFGVRSVAVSSFAEKDNNFELCAEFINKNVENFYHMCDDNVFFNVNIPNVAKDEIKGVVVTKLGVELYTDMYKPVDGKEDTFLLHGVRLKHDYNDDHCDVELIKQHYIVVSPLTVNSTHHQSVLRYANKEFML